MGIVIAIVILIALLGGGGYAVMLWFACRDLEDVPRGYGHWADDDR